VRRNTGESRCSYRVLGLGQHRQSDAVDNRAGSAILRARGRGDRVHREAIVAQRVEVVGVIPVQQELGMPGDPAEGSSRTRTDKMKDLETAVAGNRQHLARGRHIHIAEVADIHERHVGGGAGGGQASRAGTLG
jgi:hypothetical protein